MSNNVKGPVSRVVHAGRSQGRTVGPVIEKGSTVLMPNAAALYDENQVTYGRAGLTTQEALAEALCELEGATRVRLFPSGLSAVTGSLLALLKAGEELLVTDAIYKPTRRFCDHVLIRFGVTPRYYDPTFSADDMQAMLTPRTRLILMESPGSLTFEMQDVPGIARMARSRGVLTLLDNTWAAGFWFKPLAHGVDISVQALTKYVGGCSDLFMGSAATADPDIAVALDDAVRDVGWSVSPEDAYQVLRGLRSLPVRLARHQESGLSVAQWLRGRSEVAQVLFPALPGAPDHEIWRRDYTGAAGLFTFVLTPRPAVALPTFLDALKVFRLGFSWGGFESLALHCDPQFGGRSHVPSLGPAIRLSIGLEDPGDLIADLERGFLAIS
ncbi:MAG TPA: cystathionine beta-lyase [Caulobacteraceae bacterium]|jgi:cystathionine beta-lyase